MHNQKSSGQTFTFSLKGEIPDSGKFSTDTTLPFFHGGSVNGWIGWVQSQCNFSCLVRVLSDLVTHLRELLIFQTVLSI